MLYRVDFKFGLLRFVRFNGDSIHVHFTITLAGLKNIVPYTGDFVISGFFSIYFVRTCDGLKNNYRYLYRGLRCNGNRYFGVLFRAFYCNFGRAEEYRSLYRGLRYEGVRYIRVLLHTLY